MTLRRRSFLAAGALGLGAVATGCSTSSRTPAGSAQPGRSATAGGASASSAAGGSAPASGPAAAGTPAGPVKEIVHGPRTGTGVALTFHGAGDPALATALLTEAEQAGARVTVLAVGTWLEQQPQMARRILDGGHELGNHTWSHGAIATMPRAAAQAEVDRCAAQIRTLTGSPGLWFRPSQTAHATALLLELAGAAGYRASLSYDVDSLDYTDPGPAAVVRTTLGAVQPGSIVSLHLGHAGTVSALPQILAGLRAKGLQPVTVSTLLG